MFGIGNKLVGFIVGRAGLRHVLIYSAISEGLQNMLWYVVLAPGLFECKHQLFLLLLYLRFLAKGYSFRKLQSFAKQFQWSIHIARIET